MVSKQIAYCSIEEAWGTQYANLYKKNDSMLPKMPKEDKNPDDTILQDRSLTEVSNYYMDKKKEINKSELCENFIEHFMECEECKNKLNNILDIKKEKSKKEIIEGFGENIYENYFDIFILILVGIFIIFVLDCFVRLGKKFS